MVVPVGCLTGVLAVLLLSGAAVARLPQAPAADARGRG